MKKILSIIVIILLYQIGNASDYQTALYPGNSEVTAVATSTADTVKITIHNSSAQAVTGFYITAISYDSVFSIENVVDGVVNSPISYEITDGAIYPSKLTTSFIIGTFTDSVTLKFHTLFTDNSSLTFCGQQPSAFFGIAEPIVLNCCIALRGNIDNDPQEMIDISDLVYLVDFMFTSGPSPICFDEGNLDGQGDIDISDLVLLVDVMFTSGGNSFPADCP